jgi:hypothetical protein
MATSQTILTQPCMKVRANNSASHEVSMKTLVYAVTLFLTSLAFPGFAAAQQGEPTIYVIQKGDTLWGISDRFIKDPYYWPNLWARNQKITNPHLIFPGQRLRIFPDRIEIVDVEAARQDSLITEQSMPEIPFAVSGTEGFLLENGMQPAGSIIMTNNERLIVGDNDPVYTDIGTATGAKTGDLFAIYKRVKAVRHPITSEYMGDKILPLGTLRLTAMEEKSSRAIITKSFLEIGPGSLLLPNQDHRQTIMLKAAQVNLDGYIIDSRLGNITIGDSDVVYLDLGKVRGLEAGNMLYVVRDMTPNPEYVQREVAPLPQEVIGALVVIETGEQTATALVVKSIREILVGDKVRLFKN